VVAQHSRSSAGVQSMSKNDAKRLDGPFSSTSHHQELRRPAATDMWLGTMSTMWPRPAAARAATMRSKAGSPPSSSFNRLWSTTS